MKPAGSGVGSQVEAKALEVFARVNPSETGIEDETVWAAYSARLARQFTHECRLPPAWLRGISVLDVGCGTGEKSLVMASWGARVTGIDFNAAALERAKKLAAAATVPHRPTFLQESLSDLSPSICGRKFELCYADGVLHHLSEPQAGLESIASLVADGGYFAIRCYHPITSLQRFMKRFIVRVGAADPTPVTITENVQRLFVEDLSRSVAIAGRGHEQAIHDNFVAPYRPISLGQILEVCQASGFEIYAQSPSPEAPALLGPGIPAASPNKTTLSDATASWGAAAAARSMVASGPATESLSKIDAVLAACADLERKVETSLAALLDQPGADSWRELTQAADRFVASYEGVVTSLGSHATEELQQFRQELTQIASVVAEAVRRGQTVAALPPTEVLFRGTSGMTMAFWVLHKKDGGTPSPLRPRPISR